MKRIIAIGAGLLAVGLVTSNVLILQKVSKLESDIDQVKKDVNEVVMYRTTERLQVSEKDMHCLIKNIFHEAGVEDHAGKVAVAQITLNRLRDGRWGKSICEVVYSKAQFSWTLQKKLRWSQPKGKLWDDSVRVAHEFAKEGKRIKGIESSIMYHADYIQTPYWAKKMQVAHKIGQHIFYHRT